MSDEHERADSEWLIEPPLYGKVEIQIGIAEGAELSREFCDAVERLMKFIQSSEDAQGSSPCPPLAPCNPPFSCGLGRCERVFKGPCFSFVSCRIQDP